MAYSRGNTPEGRGGRQGEGAEEKEEDEEERQGGKRGPGEKWIAPISGAVQRDGWAIDHDGWAGSSDTENNDSRNMV